MIISDAPSCGVTYDHHSDDCIGIFMLPESSIVLLENNYIILVAHDIRHVMIKISL